MLTIHGLPLSAAAHVLWGCTLRQTSKGGELLAIPEVTQPKPEKVEAVNRLRDIVNSSATAILADQTGLNVKQISELRRRLEDAGAKFTVVKNTLFRLATVGTSMEPLGAGLEGPTALAYSSADAVAIAKAIFTFIREFRAGAIKRAFVDGSLLTAEDVNDLAILPPKEVLIGQALGSLISPLSGFVGTLQTALASFAFTLQSVAEKREAA